MSVHVFPRSRPVGNRDLPPTRVIVAPHPLTPGTWIGWAIGRRGASVIAADPDELFVRDASANFARHHGLVDAEFRTVPLVHGQEPPTRVDAGRVYVCPSCRDGGSWDVVHESASGTSGAVIGNGFSYTDAERIARQKAAEMGAGLAL